jgi:SAM-dependent methyltransferase
MLKTLKRHIKYTISSPLERFACNFCGSRSVKYEPDHSEANLCPVCGCVSRERVIYRTLLSELGEGDVIKRNQSLRGLSVLELSPRDYERKLPVYKQVFKNYLASDYDLSAHTGDIALDITDEKAVKAVGQRFDVVIFAHVMEHIPDYKKAIANLPLLLNKGGVVIFQVPLQAEKYTKITWDEFHGDNTRAYHRFGFDVIKDFEKYFDATVYVGQMDPKIVHEEVDPNKYDYLKENPQIPVKEFGQDVMRKYGLGSADLCDAIVFKVKA